MAFRFLHLADLHLETPFGGRLESTRQRLRTATFEAFSSAVDFALEEELHAVLVAGDLYDDQILSLRTARFIEREVLRLVRNGVAFVACAGNHDPARGRSRGSSMWATLAPVDGVHVFGEGQPRAFVLTNSAGVDVGRVVGAGHSTSTEARNLLSTFPARGQLDQELPTVGLLHTQVESARGAESHSRYAPSHADDFARLDYDYYALGHVHLRQKAVDDYPAYYAGNLQGRNARETGAKGGLMVEAVAGAESLPKFVRFGPVRWVQLDIRRLDSLATEDALLRRLEAAIEDSHEDGEECAIRLVLRGASPLTRLLRTPEQRTELEEALRLETGALEVELKCDGLMPAVDLGGLKQSPTVLAQALDLLDKAKDDERWMEQFAPLTLAVGELEPTERSAYLRELLQGAEAELVQRFLESGPDETEST